ncbi:hypothetical protein SARC_02700 [Sphaeroforma arctica JP610]|uniref:Uncharacterized protein n=1 Tax=Sphaeroforma arctica JP610 TaxID=667725 RepID=A0A0L0G800_9EUKA|nr:hypothetical protein SARC_02700 [Sphaeroforma arctica JP610]KNC85110.1 hypothetical protein SARC_02700 [Sphaeroforma arctica JP610]|eukprot:XP_014159012.1 hypothetical protein SARC_02700 [Sphaeroforma arctica JP610]
MKGPDTAPVPEIGKHPTPEDEEKAEIHVTLARSVPEAQHLIFTSNKVNQHPE